MQCVCGFTNEAGARFCGKCGTALQSSASHPPPERASATRTEIPSEPPSRRTGLKPLLLVLIAGAAWGGYYFFLRHDPVRDGERAAAAVCECTSARTARHVQLLNGHLASFGEKQYERRQAAGDALRETMDSAETEYQLCIRDATSKQEELKDRYASDRAELERFEFAIQARGSTCRDREADTRTQLLSEVFAKHQTIVDLEADINEVLIAQSHEEYRVVTDKDRNWDKYEFDNFVTPERSKFSYYPYIVKGDFDGDNVPDLAAEVRNTNNGYTRLALLWGKTKKLTFYDGQLCSALSFVPAAEWKSHWEEASVTLTADAIMVSCYEKSAWLLYWNGRSFQQYWMSD